TKVAIAMAHLHGGSLHMRHVGLNDNTNDPGINFLFAETLGVNENMLGSVKAFESMLERQDLLLQRNKDVQQESKLLTVLENQTRKK
ncbi:hypothetical protein RRG08_060128, partial [Elysia crispata]